ncbi:hypothetical protein KBA73_01175 [Patescibacteria group bacterium]|nr:hypothetical protein [Patescibacteria group bacterium]
MRLAERIQAARLLRFPIDRAAEAAERAEFDRRELEWSNFLEQNPPGRPFIRSSGSRR